MRRKDRAQSREFSLELIDRCTHGVMAISTGEETPYCLPLSFVRVDDCLYFHCAREGRKLDLLARNPKVCVTFIGDDRPFYARPEYSTYFQSAIVTGTASEVTDPQEKWDALKALCAKMTPGDMDSGKFEEAMKMSLTVTAVWRIDLEEVSGKAKLSKQ